MHTLANPPPNDDIRDRIHALDIDVSCALRFARVALQALASVSEEARQAIDRGLAEEIAMTRIEDMDGSAAVAAVLSEARHHIANTPRGVVDGAAREIERMLVERAADLTDDDADGRRLQTAGATAR